MCVADAENSTLSTTTFTIIICALIYTHSHIYSKPLNYYVSYGYHDCRKAVGDLHTNSGPLYGDRKLLGTESKVHTHCGYILDRFIL